MSAPGSRLVSSPLRENTVLDSWYIYIVRCSDDSLYTGITKDLEKRILEHNSGPKGARYTRSRRPVTLVYYEQAGSRSAATSREALIKKLKTTHKRLLVTPDLQAGNHP